MVILWSYDYGHAWHEYTPPEEDSGLIPTGPFVAVLAGSFMRRKGAVVLKAALERYGSGEGGEEDRNAAVTREACGALRSVTLGDDRRKDFSGAVFFVRMV